MGWQPLLQPGEGTFGPLAVGTNADGRLEVFAPDIDGAIWHRWQRAQDDPDLSGGGWKPPRSWHSLSPHGSPSADHGPVVARNAGRRLELFIVADDGAVWQRAQRPEGDWFDWRSLGSVGENFIDIGVGARADRRLVLVAATEGQLFYQEQQQQPNNPWPGRWRRFPHTVPTGSTGPLGTAAKPITLAPNGDGVWSCSSGSQPAGSASFARPRTAPGRRPPCGRPPRLGHRRYLNSNTEEALAGLPPRSLDLRSAPPAAAI